MDMLVVSIITIAAYVLAGILQGMNLGGQWKHGKFWLIFLGFLAVCLHGILLHRWIDVSAGQNLNFFNMLSLSAWLVSVLIIVMMLVKPVEALVIFVFPVAAVSILLVLGFPNTYIIDTVARPDTLFHILLSVITFCVMCVAGLLALLLALQDSVLRKKQGSWMIERLPPLESLERLLFQTIGFGFVLLSVVIVSSVYFYHPVLIENHALLQKTLLVGASWVIFAVLLLGRYYWGWRGRRAIYGTLGGVLLLFLAYYGSKLVLEALR